MILLNSTCIMNELFERNVQLLLDANAGNYFKIQKEESNLDLQIFKKWLL